MSTAMETPLPSPLSASLVGTRVVSLAINLPGPLTAANLAALGAEVLKVEPPTGDPLGVAAPGWYDELHEQVKVVPLDLKQADQRATLDELLAEADVLITAHRPSALTRLGLDRLEEQHPRLVHVEIVGHDGARAEEPGHDLTYQADFNTLSPPTLPTVRSPTCSAPSGPPAPPWPPCWRVAPGAPAAGTGSRSRMRPATPARRCTTD